MNLLKESWKRLNMRLIYKFRHSKNEKVDRCYKLNIGNICSGDLRHIKDNMHLTK
jgi:hypothetical protein